MYCGRKLGIGYLHVDHKTPLARSGSNSNANLQLICGPCNSRKGNMTDGEFRRKYGLIPSRQAKAPPQRAIPQSHFSQPKKAVAKRGK